MTALPPGLAWLAGGLLLMLAEVLAPGAFLVWIGLAAIGTGLATQVLTLDFRAEVVVFALLSAAAIAGALRLRRRRRAHAINMPTSGLVGRPARALAFDGRDGRVRVGDSDWPARLEAGGEIAPATPLDIVGIDGVVLLVRRSRRPPPPALGREEEGPA